MISLLPNSILAAFLVMDDLHPEELAELSQTSQVIVDLCGRMTLEISDDMGDSIIVLVADNSMDVIDHDHIAVQPQIFALLAELEAIHNDLKQVIVEQYRHPETRAGCDKVGIGFRGNSVDRAHERIEILVLRVTDEYPSPTEEE